MKRTYFRSLKPDGQDFGKDSRADGVFAKFQLGP